MRAMPPVQRRPSVLALGFQVVLKRRAIPASKRTLDDAMFGGVLLLALLRFCLLG